MPTLSNLIDTMMWLLVAEGDGKYGFVEAWL